MLLGSELGDKRCGDRVIRTDENADEESSQHELKRRRRKDAQDGKDRDCDDIDREHLLSTDGIGQISAENRAEKIPSITDAPIAALSAAVRSNKGTIWVKATPIKESTYAVQKRAAAREEGYLAQKGRHGDVVYRLFRNLLGRRGDVFHLGCDSMRTLGLVRALRSDIGGNHTGHRVFRRARDLSFFFNIVHAFLLRGKAPRRASVSVAA